MTLEDLGYHAELEAFRQEQHLGAFDVGRVISEHKERYIVKTVTEELEAEIVGALRFSAQGRSDFPAVGDWVAVSVYDEGKALIHAVFPRKTTFGRRAVGKHAEKQIIATNIDKAFIVQAVDQDFNINRLERYLAICHQSGVAPIIILNKTDLMNDPELEKLSEAVSKRVQGVPIILSSNLTQRGYTELLGVIEKGKTYCLLGSSGVGKSTLLNHLAGKPLQATDTISESTGKGRHITTHRELVLLPQGGILIDNPGMREVGIADVESGLEITFETIVALSENCKFNDCTHTNEAGCAVLAALEQGQIDEQSYQNFLKMRREEAHFAATVAEKRKRDKAFGKMVKQIKKLKK